MKWFSPKNTYIIDDIFNEKRDIVSGNEYTCKMISFKEWSEKNDIFGISNICDNFDLNMSVTELGNAISEINIEHNRHIKNLEELRETSIVGFLDIDIVPFSNFMTSNGEIVPIYPPMCPCFFGKSSLEYSVFRKSSKILSQSNPSKLLENFETEMVKKYFGILYRKNIYPNLFLNSEEMWLIEKDFASQMREMSSILGIELYENYFDKLAKLFQ